MRPTGLAYLATPYSNYKGGDLQAAFADASKIAARLIAAGVKVYSPISHGHPIAFYGGLDPLDHKMWLDFDEVMMAKADILVVAKMEGWDSSKGIALEVEHFERASKPIFDLDPLMMTMVKRKQSHKSTNDAREGATP